MARRGENIYRRRDGRYEGRYVTGKTAAGKTRFGYVYGHSYAEVKRALSLKKAGCAQSPAEGGCTITVAQWMNDWLENELLGSVRPSSYQTYLCNIRKHIIPALGGVRLNALTPSAVCDFLDGLECAGLSGNTIRRVYRLLSSALRCALEEGLIHRNPCRKIRIQPAESAPQRVLTRHEQEKLRNSAADVQNLPALVGLYTGMRLGEICALRWSDIDWERKTISVRRTAQRIVRTGTTGKTQLIVGAPKSLKSCRVIPVPDFPLEHLRRLLRAQHGDGYIFGTPVRAAEPPHHSKTLCEADERAGCLRRTFSYFASQLCHAAAGAGRRHKNSQRAHGTQLFQDHA